MELISTVVPDAETFTKIATRRARNPELERMMAVMQQNTDRRIAAVTADLNAKLAAGAAPAAASSASSSASTDEAKPNGKRKGKVDAAPAGDAGSEAGAGGEVAEDGDGKP